MPAAVAVPLITGAISGATTLAAAKMGANASRRAGDIQATYADRALADETRRRADHDAAYRQWQGGSEVAKLGDLLGLARGQNPLPTSSTMPVRTGSPQPMPRQTTTINELRSVGSGSTPAAQNVQRMVTLRAPDGEQRTFAASDPRVQRHLQRGAVRVGGGR